MPFSIRLGNHIPIFKTLPDFRTLLVTAKVTLTGAVDSLTAIIYVSFPTRLVSAKRSGGAWGGNDNIEDCHRFTST